MTVKLKRALAVLGAAAIFQTAAHAGYVTFNVSAIGVDNLTGINAGTVNFQQTYNFDFDINPTVTGGSLASTARYKEAVTSSSSNAPYDARLLSVLGPVQSSTPYSVGFTSSKLLPETFSIGAATPLFSAVGYLQSISVVTSMPYTTSSTTFLTDLFSNGLSFAFIEHAASGLKGLNYAGVATVASFSATDIAAPVPEPETYAMLLGGLGLMGLVARRRNRLLAGAKKKAEAAAA